MSFFYICIYTNIYKRTGIVTPLKITEPRHDVKCQICINEDRSRWAFGLCQLCDKFLCKEHMVVVMNNSYCNPCRNNPALPHIY